MNPFMMYWYIFFYTKNQGNVPENATITDNPVAQRRKHNKTYQTHLGNKTRKSYVHKGAILVPCEAKK